MSRKGVTTKRVKTVQTALSRTAPNRAVRLAENDVPRSAKVTSVRLKSRPKFQTDRPITQRPGKHCPAVGQASNAHATPRTTKRASRETSLAAAQPVRVPRPMHPSEPGKNVPRPAENFIGQISSAPTTPADRESVRPDRSDSAHDPTVRPIVPTDRPNAAVDPKPF
ncbi:unnamed protein product [Microthlaspi erraticum]|uniref:Uncharacterized protein n=1 Tax=Microthlaspi erraticum TaxID=1685480 RepID=A0A6D2JMA5_9BRAS|nr:unnamed protein product [Microthlaspi erraticum]